LSFRPASLAWAPALAILAQVTVGGCTSEELPDPNAVIETSAAALPPERPSSLIDTSWRLLGYHSFESGSEPQAPATGERHVIHFERDGTLAVQLACNRGSGRWQASQREPDRGGLEISSIAVSGATCPGARMDRVAEDLEYVGSYVIGADATLTLNLRADSGNLVWKRSAPADEEANQ
jgi:heat shock protein HslJ